MSAFQEKNVTCVSFEEIVESVKKLSLIYTSQLLFGFFDYAIFRRYFESSKHYTWSCVST